MIALNRILWNPTGCLVFAENPMASFEGPQTMRGCMHLGRPLHVQGVIEPTLSPTAPRRLAELVEGCCAGGYGHHRERGELRRRSAQGRSHTTGQMLSFRVCSPCRVTDPSPPWHWQWQNVWGTAKRGSSPETRCSESLFGLRSVACLTARMTGLCLQPPGPLNYVHHTFPSHRTDRQPYAKSHHDTIRHDSRVNKDTPSRHNISRV